MHAGINTVRYPYALNFCISAAFTFVIIRLDRMIQMKWSHSERGFLFAPRAFWAGSRIPAEFLELGLFNRSWNVRASPSDSEKFFTPETLSPCLPKCPQVAHQTPFPNAAVLICEEMGAFLFNYTVRPKRVSHEMISSEFWSHFAILVTNGLIMVPVYALLLGVVLRACIKHLCRFDLSYRSAFKIQFVVEIGTLFLLILVFVFFIGFLNNHRAANLAALFPKAIAGFIIYSKVIQQPSLGPIGFVKGFIVSLCLALASGTISMVFPK